jgi:hypothetical protein
MLTLRARSKFRTYPSPAASHWVHEQYVQAGGQFSDSVKDDDEHKGKHKGKKK